MLGSWSLRDIEAFIDAFDEPYAGASTFLNGVRVRLRRATAESLDGAFHPFQTGLVYRKSQDRLFIAATEGSLVVGEVLSDEGTNILQQVRVGDRFYSPSEYLEGAKRIRVFYRATGLTTEGRSALGTTRAKHPRRGLTKAGAVGSRT
ncbi:MAG: hypothetical protein HYY59_07660 [Candidatus Omnitrophica bacterium]|nr:hypothetical protein [Candidatus Omnitrophota bacterium]